MKGRAKRRASRRLRWKARNWEKSEAAPLRRRKGKGPPARAEGQCSDSRDRGKGAERRSPSHGRSPSRAPPDRKAEASPRRESALRGRGKRTQVTFAPDTKPPRWEGKGANQPAGRREEPAGRDRDRRDDRRRDGDRPRERNDGPQGGKGGKKGNKGGGQWRERR